jgi:hypothetical protein
LAQNWPGTNRLFAAKPRRGRIFEVEVKARLPSADTKKMQAAIRTTARICISLLTSYEARSKIGKNEEKAVVQYSTAPLPSCYQIELFAGKKDKSSSFSLIRGYVNHRMQRRCKAESSMAFTREQRKFSGKFA